MLAIKYFAKKENWLYRNMTKECKTKIGTAFQIYIYNDLISCLVHIALILIFGILANFCNESLMIDLLLYVGLVPFGATALIYIIAGVFVNPIKSLIIKWRK